MGLGGKGPWVILGIGIAGLIGLGVLANMMLQNPKAQRSIAFRSIVRERYDVERVAVKHEKPSEYRVELIVDPAEFRPASDPSFAPPRFTDLMWAFQDCYVEGPPYRLVTFEFRSEDAPETAAPLSTYRFDQDAFDKDVEQKVKALLGARCRFRTGKDRVLRVENADAALIAAAARAARELVHFHRGAWKRMEIQSGDATHAFDGSGAPLAK